MPNFSDFLAASQSKGSSNVRVNDLLRAQSKGGVAGNENDASQKLKDIAEMFISAEKQVEDELRTFGSKEVVAELAKINKGFSAYADNLSMMKFYLSKFSNENADMGKEDAEKLQELVAQNERLVGSINNMRSQDKDFNNKVQEIERRNEFHFRSQGIMEIEQAKMQKKYNLSESELWKNIGSEIDQLKETVKNDVKTGLIEGVGGPIGTLAHKVFLPGLKAIKDSSLGKALGPRFDKFGSTVKGLFIKNADEQKVLDDAIVNEVGAEDSMAAGQTELIDAVDNLSETNKADTQTTDNVLRDSLSNVAEEIVLPSPSLMKRKFVLEDRAKKGLVKPKEPGVFRKIQDATEQSNMYLSEMVNLIKGQKDSLDQSYESLAQLTLIGEEVVKLDETESMHLLENSDAQEKFLEKIKENSDIQNRKTELINRFNNDVFEYDKEALIESNDDRDEDLKIQAKILDELDDLNHKDMGGGGSGFMGNLLGNLLGKGGLGMLSKGLLKKAGIIGLVVSIADIATKAVTHAMGIKQGGYEINPETGHYEYKQSDKDANLFSMIGDMPQMISDFWLGRVKGGNWNGDYVKTANDMRNQKIDDEVFNKAVESGQAAQKDIIKLSKEDILHYFNPDDPNLKRNMDSMLGDLFDQYEVRPRGIEIGGQLYQFNQGGEPEKDQLTEEQLLDMMRKVRDDKPLNDQKQEDKKTSSISAPVDQKEVKTTAMIEQSELDKDVMQVDKESNELKALAMAGPSDGGSVSNTNVNMNSGVGSQNKKKQNLDEISILPQDNFGLILVNSGMNIV